LTQRRDEIFDSHRSSEESRRILAEPDVELEEMAQKESMADILAQLDGREKAEIEAIDRALAGMEIGEYGHCEACGRRIAVRRLEAIPWTPHCGRCAQGEGGTAGKALPPDEIEGLPPEYAGLSADELGEIIADEVRQDEGVDLEELRIALREGEVHLEGFLPTEAQHRRLLEIVEDHMGITNIVDEITINPASWEREDRTPGRKEPEDILNEIQAEETDTGQGPIASRKIGTPLVPPDALEPEE
jgi:RNA polymerase-binding transcription factor DksA